MYSLLRNSNLRDILCGESLPFTVALVVAQLFFKWGSFSLELLGFLALWWVLGWAIDHGRGLQHKR